MGLNYRRTIAALALPLLLAGCSQPTPSAQPSPAVSSPAAPKPTPTVTLPPRGVDAVKGIPANDGGRVVDLEASFCPKGFTDDTEGLKASAPDSGAVAGGTCVTPKGTTIVLALFETEKQAEAFAFQVFADGGNADYFGKVAAVTDGEAGDDEMAELIRDKSHLVYR